jgi:hypothetical protein
MGIGLKENRSRRQTEMARVIPNAGPVHPLHVVCKFKPRTCRRRKATRMALLWKASLRSGWHGPRSGHAGASLPDGSLSVWLEGTAR